MSITFWDIILCLSLLIRKNLDGTHKQLAPHLGSFIILDVTDSLH